MLWQNCLILFLFTTSVYKLIDVGASATLKSRRGQSSFGFIKGWLFEEGNVREAFKSEKSPDETSQWKDLTRSSNSQDHKQETRKKFEAIVNERYGKYGKIQPASHTVSL